MKALRSYFKNRKSVNHGFTLIEILIVVAILAILILMSIFYYQRHLMRSRDARRKSDLAKIKVAFEEYYNDHYCYPDPVLTLNCGSDDLSPYLKGVLCDPYTNDPYPYFSLGEDYCNGYRLLADLEIDDDLDITGIGCDPQTGCGWPEDADYNYGVAVGDTIGGSNWSLRGSTADQFDYCKPEWDEDEGAILYKCHGLGYEELLSEYDCPVSFDQSLEPACDDLCDDDLTYIPGVYCTFR